jgi:hypothetical protein
MVNLALIEDRPTPKEVYNWKVYALAGIAAFAAVMIGYDVRRYIARSSKNSTALC